MGLNKVYELASYASSHNLSFYYQNPFGDKPKKADLPSPYDCHLKYYLRCHQGNRSKNMTNIIMQVKLV